MNKESYSDFGGELQDWSPAKNFNKANATDITAEAGNKYRSDSAGMTQTAFQIYLKIYIKLNVGTIIELEPSWDKGRTEIPVITHAGAGRYTITFPTTYYDLRGKQIITNLFAAQSNLNRVQLSGFGFNSTVQRISPNVFELYTFSSLGVLTDIVADVDLFIY
jgi:hypothetical protein